MSRSRRERGMHTVEQVMQVSEVTSCSPTRATEPSLVRAGTCGWFWWKGREAMACLLVSFTWEALKLIGTVWKPLENDCRTLVSDPNFSLSLMFYSSEVLFLICIKRMLENISWKHISNFHSVFGDKMGQVCLVCWIPGQATTETESSHGRWASYENEGSPNNISGFVRE